MSELLNDQIQIIGSDAKCIFDVGSHTGATTIEYLDSFPNSKVFAFEPEPDNLATVRSALSGYAGRTAIFDVAIDENDGSAVFHVNSHSGTHSLLPIGDVQYWAGVEHELRELQVRTRSLDSLTAEHCISFIDIVKMDIQGGELAALKGASGLLSASKIALLALEVEFKQLYKDQPMFWDICGYLQQFGYSFYRLYDPFYHPKNERALCWGDAIFLSPYFTQV